MNEAEKKTICRQWPYLLDNLTAKNITPHFISAEILTPDDDQQIKAAGIPKDQNDAFLKLILKKGGNVFDTLLKALKTEHDEHIASALEEERNDIIARKQEEVAIKREGLCIPVFGQRRPRSEQALCYLFCPNCSRPLVCPTCSSTYDDAFSAGPAALSTSCPPQFMHKASSPFTETTLRNSSAYRSSPVEDTTLRKTYYSDDNYPIPDYETLKFGDEPQRPAFGLDCPDGPLPGPTESQQIQYETDSLDYTNIRGKEYENVLPDTKLVGLSIPLELPVTEIDPDLQNHEYFQYYEKHLGRERGWYPLVNTVADVQQLLEKKCTENGQYLIWFEAEKFYTSFISIYSEGRIRHFRIDTSPKTDDKKRMFYIDSSYQFQRLEDLVKHVKEYGLPLDKEFRPEPGLY